MRTPAAIVLGVAIGAVAAGGAFVALHRQAGPGPVAPARAVTPSTSPPAEAKAAAEPARPITPDYRPASAAPAAAPTTIYRCRSTKGTTYSNEPCDGGRVVDPSSAVVGYETRPSDRLARQVAEGRAIADAPRTPAYRVPQESAPGTRDCRTMRRQVEDIDARTAQPIDLRTLDDLRAVRQDIRTSMARLHC